MNDEVWQRVLTELRAWLGGGHFTREDVMGLLAVLLADTLGSSADARQREAGLQDVNAAVRQMWAIADAREAKR